MIKEFRRLPQYLFVIPCVALLAMLPAFLLGAGGSDLHAQSLWVRAFSQQFWQGEWYPRWLDTLFAGAGEPVFFYYPPLVYFITALFYPLSGSEPFGYAQIAASATLAVICSGYTFYRWARETSSESAALMASLLYMTAPISIAFNFYYAMLFSSLWAYAWSPLLMHATRKLKHGEKGAVCELGLCAALIILTNIPASVIMLSVAAAYVFWQPRMPLKTLLLRGIGASLLCLGLSAAYWLPAYVYRDFSLLQEHFGKFLSWLDIPVAHYVLAVAAYYLSVFVLGVLWYRRAGGERHFFLSVLIACLLLLLPVGHVLWERVLPLKLIQMQERLFMAASFALATLAALAYPHTKKLIAAAIMGSMITAWLVALPTRFSYEQFQQVKPNKADMHALAIDQFSNYLPDASVMRFYGTPEGRRELLADNEPLKTVQGDAVTTLVHWHARDIAFDYTASKESIVRIRQHRFPGFRAFLNERELDVGIEPIHQWLLVTLPSGAGRISFRLTPLLPERAGLFISAFSLLILLVYILNRQRTARG